MELTPRIREILLYLLRAEQPATDKEVADALGVSKRTILREAEYISGILAKYDLTLVRRKGEGGRGYNTEDRTTGKRSGDRVPCNALRRSKGEDRIPQEKKEICHYRSYLRERLRSREAHDGQAKEQIRGMGYIF
ncbi:MAG: HTH domain-containing protein [Butyrivibrio sp.]|nr:HTH domain-containing protein [Butyrivibrio sp.]